SPAEKPHSATTSTSTQAIFPSVPPTSAETDTQTHISTSTFALERYAPPWSANPTTSAPNDAKMPELIWSTRTPTTSSTVIKTALRSPAITANWLRSKAKMLWKYWRKACVPGIGLLLVLPGSHASAQRVPQAVAVPPLNAMCHAGLPYL